MNINESIRDWIEYNQPDFPDISDIPVYCMGEIGDLFPPFIGLSETSVSEVEQSGSVLYGVGAYEITVDLMTVPSGDDQEGTPYDDEIQWRRQLNDIIANRDGIAWMNGKNGMRMFDIRTTPPTTEAGDGVRRSFWTLTVIACPI